MPETQGRFKFGVREVSGGYYAYIFRATVQIYFSGRFNDWESAQKNASIEMDRIGGNILIPNC